MDIITQIEGYRRFTKEPGVVLAGKLLACRKKESAGREIRDSRRETENKAWKIPFVHIAGTNGKGSTAAFLASVLKEAGYQVGLFTSPHLVDFTERIRVNGRCITREHACKLAERLVRLGEEHSIHAGMFDYCTVIAVEYFEEQECDIAIMETGLGGRLDATNALGIPELAIITPIGLDHTQILGHTLVEIAREKAGILKAGSNAVLALQEPEAEKVLVTACQEQKIPFIQVGSQIFSHPASDYLTWAKGMQLGLRGAYQMENAATVLAAVDVLRKRGWVISEEAVRTGLSEARWPGRLEQVSEHPMILLDGAHNIHGVRALKRSLKELYPGRKLHFLMGVLADKDYREMLEEMLPLANRIDTVTPDSSRALKGEELARLIRERKVPSTSYISVQEALSAMQAASSQELICIFGSLYFIGEVEGLL